MYGIDNAILQIVAQRGGKTYSVTKDFACRQHLLCIATAVLLRSSSVSKAGALMLVGKGTLDATLKIKKIHQLLKLKALQIQCICPWIDHLHCLLHKLTGKLATATSKCLLKKFSIRVNLKCESDGTLQNSSMEKPSTTGTGIRPAKKTLGLRVMSNIHGKLLRGLGHAGA